MSTMTLKVNGQTHTVDIDPTTPLLYVLSDELQLRGPKFGCGLSQCGACTAIVDGNAVRTCVMPVSRASGAEITTLDGLGTPENPHPIQRAFIDEQAAQCGFCLGGILLTARAARESLAGTHLSRRGLLAGSGALTVAFRALDRLDTFEESATVFAQGINGSGRPQLDSWIAIQSDGAVTAYTGKCELGTGLFTAQLQLVADELSVPLDRLRLTQCSHALTPTTS